MLDQIGQTRPEHAPDPDRTKHQRVIMLARRARSMTNWRPWTFLFSLIEQQRGSLDLVDEFRIHNKGCSAGTRSINRSSAACRATRVFR